MSERIPHNSKEKFENLSMQESNELHEDIKKRNEALIEKPEKSPSEIEQIANNANKEAKSTEQMRHESLHASQQQENEPAIINYELKEIAYQRLLKRARRHLPTYSRTMSKVIHQPAVDTVSEAVAKTIGRPSGIIGGGLLALVGTSIYYYLAHHYGYNYNSFVFIVLMVVGFALGWVIEVIYKLLKAAGKK